jgi:isopenicillin N synthase-like dioxygenase
MTLTNLDAITAHLLSERCAVIALDQELREEVDGVFEAGQQFFRLSVDTKSAAAVPNLLEGYRPLLAEYSATPDRPDLSESFSVWPRNISRHSSHTWIQSVEMHRRLTALVDPFCRLVDTILGALRLAIDPAAPLISFRDMSYLQLNYYEPTRHDRDFLQDSHEDGHIMTLVTATAAGLEAEVDGGEFRPVELRQGEMFAMAGSLLTALTGGRVGPLYHRVRNDRNVAVRQALMFFVNPSLDVPLAPWSRGVDDQYLDIRQLAIENSGRFGLPTIGQVHGH